MDNFNNVLNPILKAYNRLMMGLNLKIDKGVGYSETYFNQFDKKDRKKIKEVYSLTNIHGQDGFVRLMRQQGIF